MKRFIAWGVGLYCAAGVLGACSDDEGSEPQTPVASATATTPGFGSPSARPSNGTMFGGMGGGMGGGANTSTSSSAVGTIDPLAMCPSSLPGEGSSCALGFLTICTYDAQTDCRCSEQGGGRTWRCGASVGNSCPVTPPSTGAACTDVLRICNYSTAEACACEANAGQMVWRCGDDMLPPSLTDASAPLPSMSEVPDARVPMADGAAIMDAEAPEPDSGAPVEASVPPEVDASTEPQADASAPALDAAADSN